MTDFNMYITCRSLIDEIEIYRNHIEQKVRNEMAEHVEADKDFENPDNIAHWLPCVEENGETVKWVCSSCRRVKSITKDKTEDCPVCGANMAESEEEE